MTPYKGGGGGVNYMFVARDAITIDKNYACKMRRTRNRRDPFEDSANCFWERFAPRDGSKSKYYRNKKNLNMKNHVPMGRVPTI